MVSKVATLVLGRNPWCWILPVNGVAWALIIASGWHIAALVFPVTR
jgi:hypothetical protein